MKQSNRGQKMGTFDQTRTLYYEMHGVLHSLHISSYACWAFKYNLMYYSKMREKIERFLEITSFRYLFPYFRVIH